MGIIKDTKASLERIPNYADQIKSLLSRHGVHCTDDLRRVARDSAFRSEVTTLWEDILKAEGGKLTGSLVLAPLHWRWAASVSPQEAVQ